MIDLTAFEGFDWDEGNVRKNLLKHRVTVKEGERVFFNKPLIIAKDPKHSGSEQRYSALGKTDKDRLLSIFFTVRKGKIRIISARSMSKKEKQKYDSKEKA